MEYFPDQWQIVEVAGTDPHLRIFGSWSGGYLDSDHWRINSGVEAIEDEKEYWKMIGFSGSVYYCHKKRYGIRSPHNAAVLYRIGQDNNTNVLEEEPEDVYKFVDNFVNKV